MTWCYCCCSRSQLNRMSSLRLLLGDNVTYTNFQEWNRLTNEEKNNNDICLLKLPYRCYVYKYTQLMYDYIQPEREQVRRRCVNWNGTNKKFRVFINRLRVIVCVRMRVRVCLWMLIYFCCFSPWVELRSNVFCHTDGFIAVFFHRTQNLLSYQLLAS